LARFSGNRPLALFKLRYRDIIITLLYNLNRGPYRILIEFTYEFIKQFLSIKFVLLKIIFDPSLILNPHVFLLSFIFANKAFTALNLKFASQLSGLDIRPSY
ncbi:hypothetical protein L207DRAFT_446580, partial [Hyaloscypha variabilis F]